MADDAPTHVEFGMAVGSLNALANSRDVAPLISTIGSSCLRSLAKLDGELDSITRFRSYRAERLLVEHEGKQYVRKPAVGLAYEFDTFPARRGNLQLWLSAAEGYEDDFVFRMDRRKLLRVDGFEAVCEVALGKRESDYLRPEVATEAIQNACIVFRYVQSVVGLNFNIDLTSDFSLEVDPTDGCLKEFELTEYEVLGPST